MPRMFDLKSIMVIGSGPIVIGQGCEFDYSGTQAIRALRDEGIRVVLVNSNPATIMTDPDMADATYIEPLTVDVCRAILEKEKVDAILPTLGGQTGLNLAVELDRRGVLQSLGVRLIGVDLEAIERAEDRKQFKDLAAQAGLDTPRSAVVHSMDQAREVERELGLPMIVRPSFTLGGSGSGMARTPEQFERIVGDGLRKSPVTEVLLEESIEGWKEFELEVMRDCAGNHVVVCSIENIDPMGTHTGDSITVAPVQTLNDKDYQRMRDAAFDILDLVGIQGGANVQFALDPSSGRIVVIEMNPRVSRSSALASKATGYPIAKVAAKLALGYTLAEIPNDIVGSIPAAFEPALDYVVIKVPRWNFEKFHGARDALGSQMQSIGEAMALGRTFNEALQKAMRSLESDWTGLDGFRSGTNKFAVGTRELEEMLETPNSGRLFAVKAAYRAGYTTPEIHRLSRIDPWFLENIRAIAGFEERLSESPFPCPPVLLKEAKRFGFSDSQLARLWERSEEEVAALRERYGVKPVVKMVDTCAGEFAAATPYYYVAYDEVCEIDGGQDPGVDARPKVMILGSGPNRIGQGIEFDYCCVHAAMALRDAGVESIMVNCNPETVSTDFDISDRLYFEPVSYEHVIAIVEKEQPDGVICQFGGQTPLRLIHRLHERGIPVLGTTVEAIDRAEDRRRCSELLTSLGIRHPACAFATSREEAASVAAGLGYPVLLRPPYVLGGRSMELVRDESELLSCVDDALETAGKGLLMLDKFIEGALEVDVDAVCDGRNVVIAGVMEHIEEAGIHSGDSSCVTPPVSLEDDIVEELRKATAAIAVALGVIGLINVQFAVKDEKVSCLEVNPRASRTVPYISKATGVQWVKMATRVCLGDPLPALDLPDPDFLSVKAPVLPFDKFPEVDTLLGPEMRSTGEVMGIGTTLDEAFVKAQMAAGLQLPAGSAVFFSVANRYKRKVIFPAKALHQMGFRLVTTEGMARVLRSHGIPSYVVPKISSGQRTIVDLIQDGTVKLVINMAASREAIEDGREIRLAANKSQIPCITTVAGLNAMVLGLMSVQTGETCVHSLQDRIHKTSDPLRTDGGEYAGGSLQAG